MSIDDSEKFLLNVLKNPSILAPVYDNISQRKPQTIKEIQEKTILPLNLLKDEALPTLAILNLIEKRHDVYHVLRPQILPETAPWSQKYFLELSILHRLAKKARKEQGWGKQAVYFLSYRYFVEKNKKIFKPNDSVLVEHLNNWFKDRSYAPRSAKNTEILMNTQKMDNWAKLAEYCGIVLKLNSGDYLVFVSPDLFFEIMKIYEKTQPEDTPCSFGQFLKWTDINFLPVYEGLTDVSDIIPPPYSDAIASLTDLGWIKLMIYGDYSRFKISEPKLGGRLPKNFSAYRCLK